MRFFELCCQTLICNLLVNVKVKFTSLTVFALHVDLTIHQLYQLLADRKSQSGTLFMMVFLLIHLGKGAKQFADILFSDPLPAVCDRHQKLHVISGHTANPDGQLYKPLFRKLNGIVYQVNDDLSDPQCVSVKGMRQFLIYVK